MKQFTTYRIFTEADANGHKWYTPQYRRGAEGRWCSYSARKTSWGTVGIAYYAYRATSHSQIDEDKAWEQAYSLLEQHANPAALAVRFVGTF